MKPSDFQLIDKPRLTKNIFEVNKEFDFQDEVSLEIDNNIRVIKESDDSLVGKVILNLVFFKDNVFKEIPFKLELEIEGYFQWDEKIQNRPEQLDSLLYENAPAVLYSYLRPIITSLTVDASLPPLVIPLMNFRDSNRY